ncbi:MAG: type VI secretion system protein TssA [Pyrinomonadaceae bacterium]
MTVEPKPPVIDLEAILSPISEENPSGMSLRYSGLYDEIFEARRADKNDAQGQWKVELKVADFRKVINLAAPALEKESKDLQIAVWLSEALVKEYGFVGLRDSLKMVSGLQEKFWETMFPEIDEGDQEGRANAISWMDTQTAFAAKEVPITQGNGYGFFNFEDSKRFDIPDNFDTLDSADQDRYRALQVQAENEKRVTGNLWRKAKSDSRRVFYEEVSLVIEECWTEYNELNRIIEEKFERNQMPGLSSLKQSLDDVQTQVKKLLEEKRVEEPDEIDESAEIEETGGEVNSAGGTGVAVSSIGGTIQNRKDALKRLSDLAEFFRRTEPHSPISYLVQRAVKWGDMPLEGWLQDVIKDEAVIVELRQMLGINTNLSDSSEEETES